MAKKIIVQQIRSVIGTLPKQRATLRALGLRKLNAERLHDDTPVIRGMIDKVSHLVIIKEVKK
jgi:large subunit ribosomal protein L30